MTRHLARPAQSRRLDRDDADLLASLWEQADFPRLPEDAPPELKDYVEEIENPKRVYAVYRASRRHNFQLLVEKCVSSILWLSWCMLLTIWWQVRHTTAIWLWLHLLHDSHLLQLQEAPRWQGTNQAI